MFEFQIFSFRGTPVFLRPLFFLLLFMVTPSIFLGLFISVLIHEIAHTLVAQNLGYPVKSIYIDFMNCAAMIDLDKSTPVDSIKIVFAGPLSNLILALFGGLLIFLGVDSHFLVDLVRINLLLGLSNLIPIFPLDGGRIFRDIVMLLTDNKSFSIKVGSIVSMSACIVLIFISIVYSWWIILFMSVVFTIVNFAFLMPDEKKS